jgi:hypothetical protein
MLSTSDLPVQCFQSDGGAQPNQLERSTRVHAWLPSRCLPTLNPTRESEICHPKDNRWKKLGRTARYVSPKKGHTQVKARIRSKAIVQIQSQEKIMSRKMKSLSTLFAVVLLLIAASSSIAQVDRSSRPRPDTTDPMVKVPTLGCCKCLGGTNTLDLSTISSNGWTVNGNPVAFPTQINQWWNLSTGPAKWVSTVATGSTGNVSLGTYDYKLNFIVPNCAIEQRVTLDGTYGGDDAIFVYLDNTANLISQCTGGWCFNTQHTPPPIVNYPVIGGSHALIVRVKNTGLSPSGMFVNAKLTGTCRS